MPQRSSATRRSLDSNRQERQVAFSNARQRFEEQRHHSHAVRERGDEDYGPIVYKTEYVEEEAAATNKSINDLIKNFEALSDNSLRDRGRSFGSARVQRSASPVKWKRKSYHDEQAYQQEVPAVIPAEVPRNKTNRGRPSVEYSEHSYHDVSTASMANSDVFTQSHVEHDNYKEPEPYVKQSKVKRTDMNRLSDPSLPHRFTNSLPPETERPPTRTKLTWSENPIMVGEAHHGEDYERGNPDLDPVAESAVYELEKRLDKMEKFELTLNKDKDGYGLSIIGMGIGADSGVEKLGIYVKMVFPGQAAEKVGIQMADQIVEVDGISLVGVSHSFAADTLRSTGQKVKFLMARDIDKESSEVRTLILNTLQAEERALQSEEESVESDISRSEDELNETYDVGSVNQRYDEDQTEQLKLMQDAQARILHQLSLSQKENSQLQNEIEHLRQENEKLLRKNRELEDRNRGLEEHIAQNMNHSSLPRSYDSTMTSNMDDLDDLEESRVDDNSMLSMWSLQDVLLWLEENNLSSLVPLFRVNRIDGKELDRIREKNDSKTLKALGVQKEQRAALRTALRTLGSTC